MHVIEEKTYSRIFQPQSFVAESKFKEALKKREFRT